MRSSGGGEDLPDNRHRINNPYAEGLALKEDALIFSGGDDLFNTFCGFWNMVRS